MYTQSKKECDFILTDTLKFD